MNFSPRGFVGQITYANVASATPVQTAGLGSGDTYPIGVTTNSFIVTDASGNTSTCAFTVTVTPFTGAISDLTCNDQINFSLPASCAATIGADQVLEGGPYGCYDDYVVEIKRGANWRPANVTGADVGKTFEIRVTDPATGNRCWGHVLIEDKLGPVLDLCGPATYACNENTDPIFAPITGTRTIAGTTGQTITVGSPITETANVSLPAGATI